MRPEAEYEPYEPYNDNVDLSCNPNLLTLSLKMHVSNGTLPYLIRLLSSLVARNLQQVSIHLWDRLDSHQWVHWLEIDRILNDKASDHFEEVKVVLLLDDPTRIPAFVEYSPLLWSRGILKVTHAHY
jgi:hypothetical protein